MKNEKPLDKLSKKKLIDKKIAIFVPVYNSASALPQVIDRIPEKLKKKVREIFVIDDASSDSSYLTIIGYQSKKRISNLKIIKNKTNLGYGGNQKKAYKYAIKNKYDIIVMLHGDAQYAPEKISLILQPLEKNEASMVFGSRMKGNPLKGGMPLWKYVGNKMLTSFENIFLGLNLSEYHSGFRAYDVKALNKINLDACTNGYSFDTDILIQFKINNLKIMEKPIPTHYGKESGGVTFFKAFLYGYNIIKSILHYYFASHFKLSKSKNKSILS